MCTRRVTIQPCCISSEDDVKIAALLLAIALFTPLNTLAQSTLALSCPDVAKIEAWRLRGEMWHCPSKDGYSYVVVVFLTKNAQERMAEILESTPEALFMVDDCRVRAKHIQILANGQLVPSDSPTSDTFRGELAIISRKTKEGAFAAAKQICPDKAPTVMLTDGS